MFDDLEEFLMKILIKDDLAHIVDQPGQEQGVVFPDFEMLSQQRGNLAAYDSVLPKPCPVKGGAFTVRKKAVNGRPQNNGFHLTHAKNHESVFKRTHLAQQTVKG